MLKRTIVLALLLLAAASPAADSRAGKPHLAIRASPLKSFSPSIVHLIAEVRGEADVEDWYCPRIEWDFGEDIGRATHEQDCPAWEEGTAVQRLFTMRKLFGPGEHRVTFSIYKAKRKVAATSIVVTVLPGVGDSDN